MATNFSPCKGSYVLNQFPSNAMFGMNGFHVSVSGAIQGHHGPLVLLFMLQKELVKHIAARLSIGHPLDGRKNSSLHQNLLSAIPFQFGIV